MILHIATPATWKAAQEVGEYRVDSLEQEGFIHFSTPQQVVRVANKFYAGQTGLLVLVVDPAKLRAELKYEPPVHPDRDQPLDTAPAEVFPHLYGPLNVDAVVQVIPYEPGADGKFTMPEGLP